VGHDVQADAKLQQFTTLAPDEPAGWANWGLLAFRQRNFDVAAERLERARTLAPQNDQIEYLIGLLESSRGRSTEAIAALRKAVEINPKNLIATYKLAEEVRASRRRELGGRI
jgi:tetratricopeptide (TPR) repeat protein